MKKNIEGRMEGREENQRNVILNMLAKGFDDAVISELEIGRASCRERV
jgi:hypothetical protein